VKKYIFILSTGRAGSTSMFRYVSQALPYEVPNFKEPHYFLKKNKLPSHIRLLVDESLSEYEESLRSAPVTVDASCAYFFNAEVFLRAIKDLPGEIFIVYLYRDPIERMASFFEERKKKGMNIRNNLYDDMKEAQFYDGDWWEDSYDNVEYNEVYKMLKNSKFNYIVVNAKDFFSKPKVEVERVLKFANIDTFSLDKVDWVVRNSSALANIEKNLFFRLVARPFKILPLGLKQRLWIVLLKIRLHLSHKKRDSVDRQLIEAYAPKSVEQFRLFKATISDE